MNYDKYQSHLVTTCFEISCAIIMTPFTELAIPTLHSILCAFVFSNYDHSIKHANQMYTFSVYYKQTYEYMTI